MNQKNLTNVDLELLTEELRKCLFAELTLLKDACNIPLSKEADEVKILLASSCSTGTAIYNLGKQPEYFYSEMIMLSRSLIEKLTNFTYLQIADSSEYKKFLLHPYYRAFHNTDRSKHDTKGKITFQFTGKEQLKDILQVQEALKIFSASNSKMDWSSLNIDQKIAKISEKTKIQTAFFLMNTLSIYSNASEALHGSLYGCALATGIYSPGVKTNTSGEINKNLLKNTALLYAQLGSMINEIFSLLSEKSEQMKEISKASIENQKVCLSIMKVIFGEKNISN